MERTDCPAEEVPEPHDHGKNLNETSPAGLIPKSLISQMYDVSMTAQASSSVPSTVKCSSEVKPFARACSTTCPRNCFATSASNSRSRFLVNTVGSPTSSSRFNPTNQRNSML